MESREAEISVVGVAAGCLSWAFPESAFARVCDKQRDVGHISVTAPYWIFRYKSTDRVRMWKVKRAVSYTDASQHGTYSYIPFQHIVSYIFVVINMSTAPSVGELVSQTKLGHVVRTFLICMGISVDVELSNDIRYVYRYRIIWSI